MTAGEIERLRGLSERMMQACDPVCVEHGRMIANLIVSYEKAMELHNALIDDRR